MLLANSAAAEGKRPNILFCFADDSGRYASAYAKAEGPGTPNDLVQTPAFDRLANEGVLFQRAFVNAPSCTPCRSSLLSGQYFFGAMTGAMAGIYLPLPAWLHVPVVVLAAMLGGMLWALVPALLKVGRGIHEVITTIMFNSIALALVNWLVNGPLSGVEGASLEAQTRRIQPTAVFHKLNAGFRALGWNVPDHVYLDYSLVIAVIAGFVVWFFLFRLRGGFDLRAVGTSVDVSRYAGIRVKSVQLGAFLASGAIAGLVGLQEVFAIRGFYTYEIASGLGLDGIAIALIGRNSPLGVVFSALLFAFLKMAGYGLQIYTKVPNSVIYVITGLMILFIVVTNELVAKYIRALRKKEAV